MQREIVLYFTGNTLKFMIPPQGEERWKQTLDTALAASLEGEATTLETEPPESEPTVSAYEKFVIDRRFLGYQIRNYEPSDGQKSLELLQKLAKREDPDADAPWRQEK